MIVFDASAVVSAAFKAEGVPERALQRAASREVIALSIAVEAEIDGVLGRPKFAASISNERREATMGFLRDRAAWCAPSVAVTDCRDWKNNKYLELALAAQARIIVSGDNDLLVLNPWRGILILHLADCLARWAVCS